MWVGKGVIIAICGRREFGRRIVPGSHFVYQNDSLEIFLRSLISRRIMGVGRTIVEVKVVFCVPVRKLARSAPRIKFIKYLWLAVMVLRAIKRWILR